MDVAIAVKTIKKMNVHFHTLAQWLKCPKGYVMPLSITDTASHMVHLRI